MKIEYPRLNTNCVKPNKIIQDYVHSLLKKKKDKKEEEK